MWGWWCEWWYRGVFGDHDTNDANCVDKNTDSIDDDDDNDDGDDDDDDDDDHDNININYTYGNDDYAGDDDDKNNDVNYGLSNTVCFMVTSVTGIDGSDPNTLWFFWPRVMTFKIIFSSDHSYEPI